MDALLQPVQDLLGAAWVPVWTLVKIFAIILPLMGCVAYLTLAERKIIGWMQVRNGPNRVSCGSGRSSRATTVRPGPYGGR